MLKSIKIRTKLIFSFLFVAIIAAVIGFVGYTNIHKIDDEDTYLYEKCTIPLGQMAVIEGNFNRSRLDNYQMVSATDPIIVKKKMERVDTLIKEIKENLVGYSKTLIDSTDAANFNKMKAYIEYFDIITDKLCELKLSGKNDEAKSLLDGEVQKKGSEISNFLHVVAALNVKAAKNTSDNNTVVANKASMFMIILMILGALSALGLGFFLSRSLSKNINIAVTAANKLSMGDFDVDLESKATDETGTLLQSMKRMKESVNNLINDTNSLSQAAIAGKLDNRADSSKHEGEYKKIIEGINKTLDSIIGPLNVAAEYVDRISKGKIPPKITDNYNGDFKEIQNNLNQCIDAVSALVKDAKMLSTSAKDGKLDTRADASKHQGDFRAIVQGVNDTLDNVIGPLNVAAEYVDRISKGDIPPKITDEYKGDFNEIKNNLNQCIDAVTALVKDAKMLSSAAIEGKLDTRADASKHQGDFRAIVQGVNDTLDNVIGPLNVAAEYVDRISKGKVPSKITDVYKGDFNEIKNNLNTCIDAISLLVKDTSMLVQSSVEGKLSTRADASKHQGDYQKIVNGINQTLDAVIDPIKEAGNVLAVMSTGDLTARMVGNYKGDLLILKESLNSLGVSLSDVIAQVLDAVQTVANGAIETTSTTESMAASAQEQAAQADEVASAVEEMSRTVSENAMSANRASEVAEQNGKIAKEGGEVVSQTILKMKDIADVVKKSAVNIEKLGESSKEIGAIISVINDIADQTNLLALNAAIEAARAGEQGRGFAVVADEVRKLAERTTEATKQIRDMIMGIQTETQEAVVAMNHGNSEVQTGIQLADKAGIALKQVVTSSQDVLDMINQIAAASEQQASTSEQIARNVSSISTVTADSAKRIEDIVHTAEAMSNETEQLDLMMSNFKISDIAKENLNGSKSKTNGKHLHKKLNGLKSNERMLESFN